MKIPPNAKRVFKGVIFDVYQWDQLLFDGSTSTFEMLKRPNTLLVIPTTDKKIFLSQEEQPIKGQFVSLLGGRQEEGETPIQGAQRELAEEAGLASEDWELWMQYDPLTKMEWTVFIFIARNCKKIREQKLDPGEKITTISVDFDTFIQKVLTDEFSGRELQNALLKLKNENTLHTLKEKLF